MTVTHAAVCCCAEEDPTFFFVPCPGSPSCSNTYSASKTEWNIILGEDPVVDDVWKYNDSNRINPCDYCGKFATSGSGAIAAPSSGFEKQDNCDDSDCPFPLLFFTPCYELACGSYTMAALTSEWETLLSLSPGSIDLSDPSTYAGTWMFKRTDGKECCESEVESPCFEFCGTLSILGSNNLCFDDSSKPASEQCLKCDVAEGKVQRINMANSSNLEFTFRNNCEDDDCLALCETQGCFREYLKVTGVKTFLFDLLIDATENLVEFSTPNGNFYGDLTGSGKTEMKFGIVIQYETYLKANFTTWNGVSSVNPWGQIYSEHCKQGCSVITNIQLFNMVDGTNSFKITINHTADDYNDNPADLITNYTATTSFSLPDQEDTLGFAKLQKRKDVYEDAISAGCNLGGSTSPVPSEICPKGTTNDDCVMVWSNNLGALLRIDGSSNYSETGTYPGEYSDSTSIGQLLGTSYIDFDATDDCCCNDIPEFQGLYWTDVNTFVQYIDSFTSMAGLSYSSGGMDSTGKLSSPFGQWRNGQFKLLFDGPGNNNWDLGFAGSAYVDEVNKTEYRCDDLTQSWSFSFDDTATLEDMQPGLSGAATRRLKIEVSISDTITSIECVDSEPTGCEDGTIDLP